MIVTLLFRNYKNNVKLKFVPICDDVDYMYFIYVVSNGVGKSAILKALDVVFDDRIWNVTIGTKKGDLYLSSFL